ncbi:hypothetical protein Moror_12681 [Moniliophthora roreri MCA 2997]|uniref:Uncharacterized protein n=1 Tax=Moniliophthora roreri (strain MCA 2997) TaxID=1381753 RepID=V2XSG0_MONRO|nr:hypothetical protein Moror_12681 [Moniliophthora roreri MCA 2997]
MLFSMQLNSSEIAFPQERTQFKSDAFSIHADVEMTQSNGKDSRGWKPLTRLLCSHPNFDEEPAGSLAHIAESLGIRYSVETEYPPSPHFVYEPQAMEEIDSISRSGGEMDGGGQREGNVEQDSGGTEDAGVDERVG